MRRENLLYLALLATVILGTIALHDDFFTLARCELRFLTTKSPYLGETFLRCSNIDQAIIGTSGVTDEASETEGWRIYKPSRPEQPGTIRVRVRKDRDTAFFYPRVSGRDSSVVLAEPTTNIVREWVVVRGGASSWTPVARRYLAPLACIGGGSAAAEPTVEIDLILTGPWAQVWHKDGAVFF